MSGNKDKNGEILNELQMYLDCKGISAHNFKCKHYKECKGGNPNFVKATEPYVGADYIKNELPRVLFVSLDPGSADKDPDSRKLVVVKNIEDAGCNPLSLHKGRHWYETHELTWRLIRKFLPGLQFKHIGSYFAHTNSAKCCHNNLGGAMGPDIMFRNCRKFIPREIEILSPDILVTQGNQAKEVVESGIYNNPTECYESAERLETCNNDNCKVYIIIIGKRKVIWIHSYHPAYFSGYWKQKRSCHEVWAEVVYEYLTYHGWGCD